MVARNLDSMLRMRGYTTFLDNRLDGDVDRRRDLAENVGSCVNFVAIVSDELLDQSFIIHEEIKIALESNTSNVVFVGDGLCRHEATLERATKDMSSKLKAKLATCPFLPYYRAGTFALRIHGVNLEKICKNLILQKKKVSDLKQVLSVKINAEESFGIAIAGGKNKTGNELGDEPTLEGKEQGEMESDKRETHTRNSDETETDAEAEEEDADILEILQDLQVGEDATEANMKSVVILANVDSIVDKMDDYPRDLDLQRKSCISLYEASTIDRKLIRHASAVPKIINAMVLHPMDKILVYFSCCILSEISSDYDGEVYIGSLGSTNMILLAMQRFPHSKRMQEAGCLALERICANNYDNALTFLMAGGITVLLHTLKEHEKSWTVVENAFHALASVAYNSDDLVKEITIWGGLSSIIDTIAHLWLFDYETGIVSECSHAGMLTSFSKRVSDFERFSRDLGNIASLSECLAVAMRICSTNSLLQQCGCFAFKCIMTEEKFMIEIANSGGVPALMSITRSGNIANDPLVRRHQCVALGALGKCKAKRVLNELIKHDAISLFLTSMDRLRRDIHIQKAGSYALTNISAEIQSQGFASKGRGRRRNKYSTAVLTVKVPKAIVYSMEACTFSHHVQISGCSAFMTLAQTDETRMSVITSGALAAIQVAMQRFPDKETQLAGLSAIIALSGSDNPMEPIPLWKRIVKDTRKMVGATKYRSKFSDLQRESAAMCSKMVREAEALGLKEMVGAIATYAHAGDEGLQKLGVQAKLMVSHW